MPSIQHMIILAIIILVLFGRGKVSELMGDFGKGIKSFKAGMTEEADKPATPPPAQIAAPPPPANQATLNGETAIDGSASKPQ